MSDRFTLNQKQPQHSLTVHTITLDDRFVATFIQNAPNALVLDDLEDTEPHLPAPATLDFSTGIKRLETQSGMRVESHTRFDTPTQNNTVQADLSIVDAM